MKVYIVEFNFPVSDEYDFTTMFIRKVFDTKEKAQNYIDKNNKKLDDNSYFTIKEAKVE